MKKQFLYLPNNRHETPVDGKPWCEKQPVFSSETTFEKQDNSLLS